MQRYRSSLSLTGSRILNNIGEMVGMRSVPDRLPVNRDDKHIPPPTVDETVKLLPPVPYRSGSVLDSFQPASDSTSPVLAVPVSSVDQSFPPPPSPELPNYLNSNTYERATRVDNQLNDITGISSQAPSDKSHREGEVPLNINSQVIIKEENTCQSGTDIPENILNPEAPLIDGCVRSQAVNNTYNCVNESSHNSSFSGFVNIGSAPSELQAAMVNTSNLSERRIMGDITNTTSNQRGLQDASVSPDPILPPNFNANNSFMIEALRRGQGVYSGYSEVCIFYKITFATHISLFYIRIDHKTFISTFWFLIWKVSYFLLSILGFSM